MRPLAVSHCVCAGFDPPGSVAPELRKFIIQFPVCRSASFRFHARPDFFNEALPVSFPAFRSHLMFAGAGSPACPFRRLSFGIRACFSVDTSIYAEEKRKVSHNSKFRSITVPVLFSCILSELQVYPGSALHGRMATA